MGQFCSDATPHTHVSHWQRGRLDPILTLPGSGEGKSPFRVLKDRDAPGSEGKHSVDIAMPGRMMETRKGTWLSRRGMDEVGGGGADGLPVSAGLAEGLQRSMEPSSLQGGSDDPPASVEKLGFGAGLGSVWTGMVCDRVQGTGMRWGALTGSERGRRPPSVCARGGRTTQGSTPTPALG
jgi:hypothetical protein